MGGPMTKQEEYVENVESLELAERLASSSDRRRMLRLAEAWVELAKSSATFEVVALAYCAPSFHGAGKPHSRPLGQGGAALRRDAGRGRSRAPPPSSAPNAVSKIAR
jgi:hypothetical protein